MALFRRLSGKRAVYGSFVCSIWKGILEMHPFYDCTRSVFCFSVPLLRPIFLGPRSVLSDLWQTREMKCYDTCTNRNDSSTKFDDHIRQRALAVYYTSSDHRFVYRL